MKNENKQKIKTIHNDSHNLADKAKKIIKKISATTLALFIIGTTGCSKNNEKEVANNKPLTTSSTSQINTFNNEETNEFDSIDESLSDNSVTAYDPITEEEISQKASKIASIVNEHNMDYTEDFIADIIRILHQIPTNDEQIDVNDLDSFLYNWSSKCIEKSINYIGGAEKFKGNVPEIHYADFFDENTIDYAIINEFDSYVNQATHTENKKDIYKAANGMLKIFYEVIEYGGKETEFGLANRNSMTMGGITTLETEIVNTLPILQEVDKEIKKLNYNNKNTYGEVEGNGYNNEITGGMNIIKLKLNPLSREEYEIWFSEQFKYVYGIPYKKAKKIVATSTNDRNFYKRIKDLASNTGTKVEYETQMISFETFARFFYNYNQGEIQIDEESDLNQDFSALEEIRKQNCQSKGMAKTLK